MGISVSVQDARINRRVIFVMSSLTVGGSEKKAAKLVAHFESLGWSLEVAYLNPPEDLASSFPGTVPLTCLRRRFSFDPGAAKRLRHYLDERQPSVVVSVNLFPLFYLFLSRCLGDRIRFPTIVLINKTNYAAGIGGRIRSLFYASILKLPVRLVFGAKSQRDAWVRRYGLEECRQTVIYNGVDTTWFSPAAIAAGGPEIRGNLQIGPSDFVIVTVAGLRRVKNLSMFIDGVGQVAREHPHVKAIIVGDGPERAYLTRKVADLSLEGTVRFVGETKDVRPLLSAADVFALTSESETFSNAALEAMSMGKPAILPKSGGSPEMIDDEVTGWLFDATSEQEFVDRLRSAVAEPDRCIRMGEAARAAVLGRFQTRSMLNAYMELISGVSKVATT